MPMVRNSSAATLSVLSSYEEMMKPIDYPARIRRLAESLSDAGIDAYVGTRQASLHYLAGAFVPWRGSVVVTSSGEAELIYWTMDSERVRQEGWGLEVIEWGGGSPPFIESLSQRLSGKGLGSGRIGLDLFIPGTGQEAPGLLYAHEYLELQRLLPNASFLNGTACIDSLMLIKTPEEVERLRLAAHVADEGFLAGLATVHAGATENMVAGAIENVIRFNGSIWAWSVTGGTEVGSGLRTAFKRGVTQQATNKKIGDNEFIILDLHPMVELYLADLGLPVFLGKPDHMQQKLIDCWEETVSSLFSALRPGERVAEICTKTFKIFEKYGMEGYGQPMFGHGLGTCARLRPFMNPKSEDVLKPGMVLALGTHLYMPGVGGLRLEYPTLITETGPEALCRTHAKVYRK